jgi:hypothetical protein
LAARLEGRAAWRSDRAFRPRRPDASAGGAPGRLGELVEKIIAASRVDLSNARIWKATRRKQGFVEALTNCETSSAPFES